MSKTLDRFAARLREALDHARFPAGRARTAALATQCAVSRETARKWLSGMSLPELERIIEMAQLFRVGFEWLATGRGGMLLPAQGIGEGAAPAYVADPTLDTLLAVVTRLPEAKRDALLHLLTD